MDTGTQREIVTGMADLDTAARTLWGEARGEGEAGLVAVAWVIRNRAARGGWWGDTVAAVCRKPWQFSCWNEGDPNRAEVEGLGRETRAYRACIGIVAGVLAGAYPDPTGGATHYHANGLGWPAAWGAPREPSAVIGRHLFFNSVE